MSMGLAIEYHQTPHTDAFDTGYCKSEALENDLRDRTTKEVSPEQMTEMATTLPDSMNAATSGSFVALGVLNIAGDTTEFYGRERILFACCCWFCCC